MKSFQVMLVLPLLAVALSASIPAGHSNNGSVTPGSESYYKMLMIIPDNPEWLQAIQPLVQWKTREGLQYSPEYPEHTLPVKVTNLTQIFDTYGAIDPSSIRSYIASFWLNDTYATGVSTLKYVLLVGDVKYIPSYLYNVTVDGNNLSYAADQYYADFYDSNMTSINPITDKTDWKAEVYVGRFPVNNAEELKIVVNKTVTYEMHPESMQTLSTGWENRMLFLGAVLNDGSGWEPTWKDGAYVAESIKRDSLTDWNGSAGPVPKATTLYDTNNNPSLWSLDYATLNNLHNLTLIDVINQISNNGFSAVVAVSHGISTALAGRLGPIYLQTSDIASLTNGHMLPFWFIDACSTGAFQSDSDAPGSRCLGAELLLSNPLSGGGAVAFIGASDLTWYEYSFSVPQNNPEAVSSLSDKLASITFNQLYASWNTSSTVFWSLGDAFFQAKHLYSENSWTLDIADEMHKVTLLGFNLLGDPSLQIWTERPQYTGTYRRIAVPAAVLPNETFTVKVNILANATEGSYPSEGPRERAKVTLSRSNGTESPHSQTELTNVAGEATFTAPSELGTYNITVTDHPYQVPYTSKVTVVEGRHDVALEDVTLSGFSIDQGSTTNINVTISNYGDFIEAFNVTVYANESVLGSKTIVLDPSSSTILTFAWNTSGFDLGGYRLVAVAGNVTGETILEDNIFLAAYQVDIVPEFSSSQLVFLLLLSSTSALLIACRKKRCLR